MKKALLLCIIINTISCGILPFDSTTKEWEKDYCIWLKEHPSNKNLEDDKNRNCETVKN